MQDRPICFKCHDVIEHSPVFEPPCGHDRCASACFHGLCLMEWRDQRNDNDVEIVGLLVRKRWIEEHTGNEPERSTE